MRKRSRGSPSLHLGRSPPAGVPQEPARPPPAVTGLGDRTGSPEKSVLVNQEIN